MNVNRNLWRLGIVENLIEGKDGIVRAAKLRCGKVNLEREVQHLYPMELHCDCKVDQEDLGDDEPVVDNESRRSTRTSAAIARLQIQDQAEEELNVPQQE